MLIMLAVLAERMFLGKGYQVGVYLRELSNGFDATTAEAEAQCRLCFQYGKVYEVWCKNRNGPQSRYSCMNCWECLCELTRSYRAAFVNEPVGDLVRWIHLGLLYGLSPRIDMRLSDEIGAPYNTKISVDYVLSYRLLNRQETSAKINHGCLKRAAKINRMICRLVDHCVVVVWILRRQLSSDVVGEMAGTITEVMLSSKDVFVVVGKYLAEATSRLR